MPEVIIKDDNGNTQKVNSDKVNKVLNTVESDKISKLCSEYWTPKKFGKHSELQKTFEDLIKKHLKGDYEEFFAALKESKYNFKTDSKKVIKNILEVAGLDNYLEKSYITDALEVTGSEPQIGKGEFLFASIFSNICFSENGGDLIDIKTKSKIEVKGMTAVLGNGYDNRYKNMSDDLLWSVFKILSDGKNVEYSFKSLSDECSMAIKKLAGIDEKKLLKVFTALQNLENENEGIARNAVKLYLTQDHSYILKIVAAMHLYIYLNCEQVKYLLILNKNFYKLYNTPSSLEEAYKIVQDLNIHQWKVGNAGISITMK